MSETRLNHDRHTALYTTRGPLVAPREFHEGTHQNDGPALSTLSPSEVRPGTAHEPLVTQRTATVGTAAAVSGVVIGALTFIEAGSLAGAMIAGFMALGASTLGLQKIIGG